MDSGPTTNTGQADDTGDRLPPLQAEQPQTDRRAAKRAFALVFAGLSLVLLMLLPSETQWLDRTKLFQQPAFWPAIALGTMGLFSLGFLVKTYFEPRQASALLELAIWVRGLEFVGWFLAYVWLVPRIGYLAATCLFASALAWRVGYRGWRALIGAAIFGLAVVVAFKSVLGVNIPAGAVYDLLPPGSVRSFLMTNF